MSFAQYHYLQNESFRTGGAETPVTLYPDLHSEGEKTEVRGRDFRLSLTWHRIRSPACLRS